MYRWLKDEASVKDSVALQHLGACRVAKLRARQLQLSLNL